MLTTGSQLRAARAMAGLHRDQLAALAGIAPQTIQRLEGMERLRANITTLNSLGRALAVRGVEFIPDGVRRRV